MTPDNDPQHGRLDLQGEDILGGAALSSSQEDRLDLESLKLEPEYYKLISLLQGAYSGEKAAAFAYQGHSQSMSDPTEKAQILKIEKDEWTHRQEVGEMLKVLGCTPASWREHVFGAVGQTLSLLCHVSGRYLPLYFAQKLEDSNVKEYTEASILADRLGLVVIAERLKEMADTEQEHADYFKRMINT